MNYRKFITVLIDRGFQLKPNTRGSHQKYVCMVKGKRRVVIVSGIGNKDIKRGTLRAMIRDSGLDKKLFR